MFSHFSINAFFIIAFVLFLCHWRKFNRHYMIALRWNIAQSFERLWWNNYLSGKNKQLYLDWKRNYWEKILQQVFDLIGTRSADFHSRPLRILDAGCGPAGIFLNFQKHRVDALDPMVNHYLEELQLIERKNYPNVKFIQNKLESFSSPEPYDYIFCMNCINHVNDIELCLGNVAEALKEGGFLVLTVDAHKYGMVKRILGSIPADILHPHQLNLDDYTNLLERNFKTAITGNRLIKRGVLFEHYLIVVQKTPA